MIGVEVDMARKVRGKTQSNDGDQLARWVLGMAQTFGHWPLTSQISIKNRTNSITMTVCDYLRLIIIIGFYMMFMLMQMQLYHGESRNVSKIVSLGNMSVHLLSTILNVLLNCWNRQNILKLLTINDEIDEQVSLLHLMNSPNKK